MTFKQWIGLSSAIAVGMAVAGAVYGLISMVLIGTVMSALMQAPSF